MKARRPGRPPRTDKTANERLEIRLTKLERTMWEHEAAKRGLHVSEWIRQCCAIGASYLLAAETADERKIPYEASPLTTNVKPPR